MIGVVIENDGEIVVLVPFAKDRLVFDYRRTCTVRRKGATQERFQQQYPIIEDAEEAKARVFAELGITEKDFRAALQRARTSSTKCQNLRQLVQTCRKESW